MASAFEIADRFVDDVAARLPVVATRLGIPGHDHEWGGSFSIEGVEAMVELFSDYRRQFEQHIDDPDPKQRLAAQVTIGTIDERIESYEAGDFYRDLRHLGSTFQQISQVFDLMPTSTVEHWEAITTRLETIDQAYNDYRARLEFGLQHEDTVAKRQVESVITQAGHLAGDASAFLGLFDKASKAGHQTDRLNSAVDHARRSVEDFAVWLGEAYLPAAHETDGVGEEQYRRAADQLVGLQIDPAEAYEWGWHELIRLHDEMAVVGERIIPGSDVAGVRDFLETDPEQMVHSREEFVEFVGNLLSQAVDDLAGKHFDVPEEIRPLTVQMAPPGGPLGAYYTPPSEDFTRPGGVWYSVGDRNTFPLYRHVSTAYHEGFPGHHLQNGTVRVLKDDLSRAQRTMTWYPGYGEGWGMYAEVLMGEFGYLDDPRHYFGMLSKQAYRAARVVVDIGLHLDKTVPAGSTVAGGEKWSFDAAVEFMRVYGLQEPPEAEDEVLRYLGWPGQAISYKLGEREILDIRRENQERLGADFDLGAFHAAVINHGAMRLDLLRQVVRERI